MNNILTFYFIFGLSLMNLLSRNQQHDHNSGVQSPEGIELVITNIRNKEGVIRIGLFKSEVGYPDKPAESFSLAKDTISGGLIRLFIPSGKSGSFGFSILDDENRDGKMDYRLGIIPKEGFGFSNNPKVSRKAPSYTETAISFTGGLKKVVVKMVYI
jgi:uncharacterized protein (DUF2141 family)